MMYANKTHLGQVQALHPASPAGSVPPPPAAVTGRVAQHLNELTFGDLKMSEHDIV
jgi:hypothetical protein